MFHLDYETYSEADLREVGAAKYAEHPSTEILMAAVASDTEGPYLYVSPKYGASDPGALPLLLKMVQSNDPIWAHSAQFEIALTAARFEKDLGIGPAPSLDRWRCTAAVCRRAGLPDSLDQAGEALSLETKKDKEGKRLIQKFSIPRKATKKRPGGRVYPTDDWVDFQRFGRYCCTDVDVERAIHQRLRPFLLSGLLQDSFLFDVKLNQRGVPVNLPALHHTAAMLDLVLADVNKRFTKLTGLAPTQRAKVKALLEDKGLPMEDMTADTVADTLAGDDVPTEARTILELYSTVQYAAAKKVYTMLDCACADGRVRGAHHWYGAGTGRWSGRLIQPQNFKRPTVKDTDLAYRIICDHALLGEDPARTRETLDLLWGNALEVVASCIRNYIYLPNGFWDADYNAVEARIVCWLAGQEDVLEDYRRGVDQYKKMAGRIYGVPADQIVNPSHEREVGKRTVLGCGFSMGAKKFKETLLNQYGIDISIVMSEKAVTAYRQSHPKVQKLWYACDRAARNAIANPGRAFTAGPLLSFRVLNVAEIPYLLMRLPSGRAIAYPWPKLEWSAAKQENAITFYGNIKGKIWGRVSTYGGKLVENATQGTAADLMMNGCIHAERAGYAMAVLIHDQGLAEKWAGQNLEGYIAALTNLPPWANGLPLKAEGKAVPYYKKS